MTNRALAVTLFGPEDLRVIESALEPLARGMVRVRFRAGGICGSDLHYFRHARTGDFVVNAPLILGHEVAGEIIEINRAATGLAMGDRVAVNPSRWCGHCARCQEGRANLCENIYFMGSASKTPHMQGAGQFQGIPRFGFSVVDVRDAAQAHLQAMTHPGAANHRLIVGGRFFWLKDLVAVLAASFPEYAARLPSGEVPNEVVRNMAETDPHARTIVHELNHDLSVSAAKARHVLNWQSRSEEEAIRACSQSLIDLGLIGTMPPTAAARAS